MARPKIHPRLWVALGSLLTAGAVFFLNHRSGAPAFDPRPHAAAGAVMAEMALGLLPAGGRLVVIQRDTSQFAIPAAEAQYAAFLQAVTRAGVTVASVQAIKNDPLRPVLVSPGDFFELLRKAPEGTVLVSFMGPPLLSEEQRAKLGPPRAKVVAFCAAGYPAPADLRALFDQQLLSAAILARRDTPANAHPVTRQDWFDQSFLAVTGANLQALATAQP